MRCLGITNSFSKYRQTNLPAHLPWGSKETILGLFLPPLLPCIRGREDGGLGKISNVEHCHWTFECLIPSSSAGNRIHQVTGLDPERLTSLHTLELRGNQIESTLGLNLPKLKNLFLVAHWALGWCREREHSPGFQQAQPLASPP